MDKEIINVDEFVRRNIGRPIRTGNTFCGGGGVSAAMKAMGCFDELVAVDNWHIAEKVFTENFADVPFWNADISTLDEHDLLRKMLLSKGELDLLICTAPCPAFSIAKGYMDPLELEAWLFVNSLEQISYTLPAISLIENVPGMTDGRATAIFNEIKQQTKELIANNYEIKTFIIKAKYFNVPQLRERYIWMLYRKDLGVVPTAPTPDLDSPSRNRIIDIAPHINAIKVGQSKKVFKRNDKIMNTITASEGGVIVFSKGQRRALTVEELLKFATFPEWYKIPEGINYSDAHEIIGNCVPVNLAKALLEHIIREVGHKLK